MGNAMLHSAYEPYQHYDTKCRDCGLIHLVRKSDPILDARREIRWLAWQLAREQGIKRSAQEVLSESYSESDYERSHPEHQAPPEDSLPSGCTLSDLEMEVPTD